SSRCRLPFFIYPPDGPIAPGRVADYASQYDVLPTLMTLLDIDQPIASFGRSLLAPTEASPGVVAQNGSIITWLAPEGTLSLAVQDGGAVQATARFAADSLRRPDETRDKTMLQWIDGRHHMTERLTHDRDA